VIPSGYGPTLPPWFLFTPHYWGLGKRYQYGTLLSNKGQGPHEDAPLLSAGGQQGTSLNAGSPEAHGGQSSLSATGAVGLQSSGIPGPAVDLKGLRMVYGNGVVAVEDLSLQVWEQYELLDMQWHTPLSERDC
jgi:hypothetical protein